MYIVVCLTCAAAGVALGYYGIESAEPSAKKLSVGKGHERSAETSGSKPIKSVRSRHQVARAALEMAVRGETGALSELIEACAHDKEALELIAAVWLKKDPAAFARAMASACGSSRRESLAIVLQNMMSSWGKAEPDAAWSAAEKFPGTMRRGVLNQLALDRLSRDPKTGLEFALSHQGILPPVPAGSLNGRRELVPLIQQLPDGAAKFQSLTRALKDVPLTEALTGIGHLPEYSNLHARRSIIRTAAKRSVDEVIAFHRTATGADRYAAAHAVGDVLVTKDPAAAVEWAKENMSGAIRNGIISTAAKALKSTDPAAAAAAEALLPEGFGK